MGKAGTSSSWWVVIDCLPDVSPHDYSRKYLGNVGRIQSLMPVTFYGCHDHIWKMISRPTAEQLLATRMPPPVCCSCILAGMPWYSGCNHDVIYLWAVRGTQNWRTHLCKLYTLIRSSTSILGTVPEILGEWKLRMKFGKQILATKCCPLPATPPFTRRWCAFRTFFTVKVRGYLFKWIHPWKSNIATKNIHAWKEIHPPRPIIFGIYVSFRGVNYEFNYMDFSVKVAFCGVKDLPRTQISTEKEFCSSLSTLDFSWFLPLPKTIISVWK